MAHLDRRRLLQGLGTILAVGAKAAPASALSWQPVRQSVWQSMQAPVGVAGAHVTFSPEAEIWFPVHPRGPDLQAVAHALESCVTQAIGAAPRYRRRHNLSLAIEISRYRLLRRCRAGTLQEDHRLDATLLLRCEDTACPVSRPFRLSAALSGCMRRSDAQAGSMPPDLPSRRLNRKFAEIVRDRVCRAAMDPAAEQTREA